MDFNGFIGQTGVVSRLQALIAHDNAGHAYIFSGPQGSGKKTAARIFASMLLCGSPGAASSCGKCISCSLFANNSHPDFFEVLPGETGIGIGAIRALQSGLLVRPMYSARKVYIIADAHKMTVEAQNCLLKTLEEPPGYAVIILTASSYDSLLATIRSRAVRLAFGSSSPAEIRNLLADRFGEVKNADFVIACSGGIIGKALELAGSREFNEIREKTLEIAESLFQKDLMKVFDASAFFESNKASIDTILDIMVMYYRDLLVQKKAPGQKILINSDKRDNILSNVRAYSERKLLDNINAVENARNCIRQNANYQLAIEVMLMKLQED